MVMQLDAFQVLADPTRRSIIEALRKGERQVNDIVEKARIHQSGVSRHLRIFLQTGFGSIAFFVNLNYLNAFSIFSILNEEAKFGASA